MLADYEIPQMLSMWELQLTQSLQMQYNDSYLIICV